MSKSPVTVVNNYYGTNRNVMSQKAVNALWKGI